MTAYIYCGKLIIKVDCRFGYAAKPYWRGIRKGNGVTYSSQFSFTSQVKLGENLICSLHFGLVTELCEKVGN